MSMIKADNWQASSGGTSVSLNYGLAKAGARWNGVTTTVLVDDFNVTSLTDIGTGTTSFTFTNNFTNANYLTSGISSTVSGQYIGRITKDGDTISTSSALRIFTAYTTSFFDTDLNDFISFGDLA